MPRPFNPTTAFGRTVAAQNELKVLRTLRHFGYLRRKEIGKSVWPSTSEQTGYIMACRTVARLVDANKIKSKPDSLGGEAFILTNKGATTLRDMGFETQDGYDFSVDGPQFYHRMLGTNYLLEKKINQDTVFGEYAILRGWSPLDLSLVKQQFHKVPDGVILHSGSSLGLREGVYSIDWIEVESGFKPYEDVKKALMLVSKNAQFSPSGNLMLNKLVFVYDNRQSHENRLMQYLKRFLDENRQLDPSLVLDTILMVRCFIDMPLVWHGMQELTAAELNFNVRDKSTVESVNF